MNRLISIKRFNKYFKSNIIEGRIYIMRKIYNLASKGVRTKDEVYRLWNYIHKNKEILFSRLHSIFCGYGKDIEYNIYLWVLTHRNETPKRAERIRHTLCVHLLQYIAHLKVKHLNNNNNIIKHDGRKMDTYPEFTRAFDDRGFYWIKKNAANEWHNTGTRKPHPEDKNSGFNGYVYIPPSDEYLAEKYKDLP